MKRLPSIWRIAYVDYGASLGVLLPVVAWGLALVGRFLDPEAAAFFLYIAPAVTIGGLVLLLWRLWAIRSVFDGGDEVPGVISGTGFFRGRGRVEYIYTYRGHKYQAANAVQSNAHSRALAPGQEVSVMVNRFNPKRAFVRELYL